MSVAIAVAGALLFVAITGYAGFRGARRTTAGPSAWSTMGAGRRAVWLLGGLMIVGAIVWRQAFDGPPWAYALMVGGVAVGLAAIMLGRPADQPWRAAGTAPAAENSSRAPAHKAG